MSAPVSPDSDPWDADPWAFLDEEIFGWDDIPLTCGVENPEGCEACD